MLKNDFIQRILNRQLGVWVNNQDEVNEILNFINKDLGRKVKIHDIGSTKWENPILLYYSTHCYTFLLDEYSFGSIDIPYKITYKEFKEITSRKIYLTQRETSRLTYLWAQNFYYLVRTVNGSLWAYSKDGSRSTVVNDIDHCGAFDFISSKEIHSHPIKNILEECELKKEVVEEEKSMFLKQDEIENLISLRNEEFTKIARDKSGSLYAYKGEVKKDVSCWVWFRGGGIKIIRNSSLFKFIKWEDDRPYSISDLLKKNSFVKVDNCPIPEKKVRMRFFSSRSGDILTDKIENFLTDKEYINTMYSKNENTHCAIVSYYDKGDVDDNNK